MGESVASSGKMAISFLRRGGRAVSSRAWKVPLRVRWKARVALGEERRSRRRQMSERVWVCRA